VTVRGQWPPRRVGTPVPHVCRVLRPPPSFDPRVRAAQRYDGTRRASGSLCARRSLVHGQGARGCSRKSFEPVRSDDVAPSGKHTAVCRIVW
jgi:hypothetical protein